MLISSLNEERLSKLKWNKRNHKEYTATFDYTEFFTSKLQACILETEKYFYNKWDKKSHSPT